MCCRELERVNVGISAHTDFEFFTLMAQDAPGLQFLTRRRGDAVRPATPLG
jgi:isopenicillin N synthase-like dioxygenase